MQGNFTISPSLATVEPGDVLKVSVTFLVQNQRTFCELLGIDVSDRDPNDHPGGIPYEIAGESCIPGINTEDFISIFEEHRLVRASEVLRRSSEQTMLYACACLFFVENQKNDDEKGIRTNTC